MSSRESCPSHGVSMRRALLFNLPLWGLFFYFILIFMNFPFCPRCGRKLTLKKVEYKKRPVCPACFFVVYRNPVPTSSALFIEKGNILLTKRAIDPQKGFWDLPGGFIEEGESPERALRREMKEELGVEIAIGKLFDIVMDWYLFQEVKFSTLNLYYFAVLRSKKLIPGDDISEAKWFSLENPPKNLSSSNNRIILSRLKKLSTLTRERKALSLRCHERRA